MELHDFDAEIARLRLEHDKLAYSAQLIDAKRKIAELEKSKLVHINKQVEMQDKIREIDAQLAQL